MNLIGVPLTRHCTFRTRQRGGVWSVTKDHVFYGDFLSRTEAVRSACSAARTVESLGGSASVLVGPSEAVVRHQDPVRR